MKLKTGFTLIELLVSVAIIATLFAMSLPVYRKVKIAASGPIAANTLNQLRIAGQMYQSDNNGQYWKYVDPVAGGNAWWFGFETSASASLPEGQRSYDVKGGTLGRYIGGATSGVGVDPAYSMYGGTLKAKFKNGPIGYGYNVLLARSGSEPSMFGWIGFGSPQTVDSIQNPSQVVVFCTSAQVNTFQAPASTSNPMIEEFVGIDEYNPTIHYRFGDRAMAVFADGQIGYVPIDLSTLDNKMPNAKIGKLAAKYLGL
ncbi:MAG: type II secretion system protein [Verrucomicrobiota bacterium]|nr:type II secretion system protein [Verrucomicrobiota bacterium]